MWDLREQISEGAKVRGAEMRGRGVHCREHLGHNQGVSEQTNPAAQAHTPATSRAPELPAPTPFDELSISDIQLITIDMDGTLLDENRELPDAVWPVIEELLARGINVVPCSGRQYWTLSDLFDQVANGLTIIAENGSIAMRDGEELFSNGLDYATAQAVVLNVRAQCHEGVDTGLVVCGKNSAYVERKDEAFLTIAREFYHRTAVVEDLHALLDGMERGEHEDSLLKLAQFDFTNIVPTGEVSMGGYARTHQYVVSGRHWCDLMNPTVNKGVAVEALQARLGVTSAQTMAFGDFLNDREMLGRAEHSFAMANAHPDIHAICRYVAPSNAEHGVLQVLRAVFDLDAPDA